MKIEFKLFIIISLYLVSCTNNSSQKNDKATNNDSAIALVQGEKKELTENKRKTYSQSDGFIPDKETAGKIAEIVLLNIYGEDIRKEMPFIITLEDNEVWFIQGRNTHYTGFGGVVYMSICKKDGRILRISHGK